jgi:Lon protease-like protein
MRSYLSTQDLPQVIPVFPLDGAILLPGGELPLRIFEPRYLNMIDDAMADNRVIGMIQTKAGGDATRPRLSDVGCVGRITSYAETSEGTYLITLTGVCRFEPVEELPIRSPYRQVRARYDRFAGDLDRDGPEPERLDRKRFAAALKRYLNRRELDIDWESVEDAPVETLVTSLSMGLPFEPAEKQALLEAPDGLSGRFDVLTALLEIDSSEGDDEPRALQ